MIVRKEVIPPEPVEPVLRIEIEISELAALRLARAIDQNIEWCSTDAFSELEKLHEALCREGRAFDSRLEG